MNLNIALSTIIYIMVFLFPGIIFRKVFFSGRFSHSHSEGTLFERFLWSIFTSIILLIIIGYINNLLLNNLKMEPIVSVSINDSDIINIFKDIYKNEFPSYIEKPKHFYNLLTINCIIYILSFLIAFLLKWIVEFFRLDHKVPFLDYLNKWDNLTESNKQNNFSHKNGDIHITNIDVKTKSGELFTGKLYKIIYNKDGTINCFNIKNTYKFYNLFIKDNEEEVKSIKERSKTKSLSSIIIHFEDDVKFIYKKRIKGEIFSIYNDNIENISISYVKINNSITQWVKLVKNLIKILSVLSIVFLLSVIVVDYKILLFESMIKRVIFALYSTWMICLVYNTLKNTIDYIITDKSKEDEKNELKRLLKIDFLLMFLFSVFYLYIFSISSFLMTLTYNILVFIIISFLMPKNKNN